MNGRLAAGTAFMRASKKPAFAYGFHPLHGRSLRFLAGAQAMRGPENVRQDIPPDTIRRKTVQNIVEFHIIGRLGRIDVGKKVTHISVATNYNRREGETWTSHPNWHRLTFFGGLREAIDKAAIGDLVRITGRIGQSKYKVNDETHYSVDLIADSFAVLAKAKIKTVKDDMEDD
jgi:single-strand DNA-binding protein